MRLTPAEVRHLADLARLALTEEETERLAAQLGAILERVDGLADEGSLPDATGGGRAHAPLRADVPAADPLAEGPDTLAPAWAEGFFTVPRLASHEDEAREGA